MAKCLSALSAGPGYPTSKLAGNVRERYASKLLKTFEFVGVDDYAPAITDIQTKLVYEEDSQEIEEYFEFRMINEDAEGRAAVRGKPNTTWVVLNWSNV
jgi:hypothetical protein